MNKVALIGRITREPELKYTTSNMAVLKFSLAINRNFKDTHGEYQADFINCVAFDKRAEIISKYVGRGDRLVVEGRIQTGSFDGDNGKVYTTDVVVEGFEFIEYKKETKEEPKTFKNDPFQEFGETVSIDDEFLD